MSSNVMTRAFVQRPRTWAVTLLVLVGLALMLDVVVLSGPDGLLDVQLGGEARRGLWQFPFVAVPYGLAGALLIARRPDLPFGWLLGGGAAGLSVSLAGVSFGNIAAMAGHTGWWVALLLALSALAFLPIAVQGLVNVRFPTGRVEGTGWRVLERLLIVGTAGVMVSGVLGGDTAEVLVPGASPVRGAFAGTWLATAGRAVGFGAPLVVLLGLIAGLGVVVRCFRAQGLERQQLIWRATGIVLSLALFAPAVLGLIDWADYLDAGVFVATLAIPVLRYRLWAIGRVIRRSTAYAVTSVLLVVAFAVVTVLAAEVASRRFAASLATVAVAFAALPAWQFSRRLVDRTFYGSRGDPARALSDVARRLEDVAGVGVLAAVVQAVAATLRLPYVAITRPEGGAVLASDGLPVAGIQAERWDLSYRGTTVGQLVASPRRGEEGFDERDRSVISDIARQAGPAVQAEALTADLLRARQRLVTAREEDRRRLRRDLHDGLGPGLTGIGLTLDAVRAALAADAPEKAELLLEQAKDANAQLLSELRQTVYDLRPPVLDELGLIGALTVLAQRLASDVQVRVEVGGGDLPELPAAVEVAAFRTATEAVTNVIRHAAASSCCVRLEICGSEPQELVVDVRDDGSDPTGWRAGVGLTAMRERAEELGGTLTAHPTSAGGHVVARYPLVAAP